MAYYNLKKKPSLTTKEGEKETMYADIVYSGTITAERLIRTVAQRTGFKEGMISAKVKSRLVENKNDLRSNSVSFDGVNFRASKSFRTGIRGDLERRRCIGFRTSKEWDREQLEQIVLQHIRKHGFITRTTYTEITGRLKNSALADLKSFAAEGIIKRVGRGNQMHFIVPPVDDL